MITLVTVWHTGTQYFLKTLKQQSEVNFHHLTEQYSQKNQIYTTYRDPKRVAASWANRGRFCGHVDLSHSEAFWCEQWARYKTLSMCSPMILRLDKGRYQAGLDFGDKPINTCPDGDMWGLHRALDDGDEYRLYKMVPKKLIDYAIECSEWVENGV